jgi:prevent-host-death family protein
MKTRAISVTEFKAKCLSLLSEIADHGGTITVTKRGRPLATVSPAKRVRWKSSEGMLEGKIQIDDDLLMSDMTDLWDPVRAKELLESIKPLPKKRK